MSFPVAAALCAFVLSLALPASAQVDGARAKELTRLVRQDCGSCHGLTLKGGLGPALLPETLRDKPSDSLVATVLFGRGGTPMPPWKGLLDERDAQWIIHNLKQGFPADPSEPQ